MIVIPMAGLSRRFSDAGYVEPKYMLPLGGVPCFDHAINSFSDYFSSEKFLFICRSNFNTPDFVARRCEAIGISKFEIVCLDEPTAGQAETVELGLLGASTAGATELTIFNIDTFRPGFRKPVLGLVDGYLEVFRGSGVNWSYVLPDEHNGKRVARTAEKLAISDLCCTGVYNFSHADEFLWALELERVSPRPLAELYIAPIYNHLISRGANIGFSIIERREVVFCGVPQEYTELVALGYE